MSAASFPSRPPESGQGRAFTIVASQYNPTFVGGLVANAQRELQAISPTFSVATVEVPGAFEIPLVIEELAARGGVDAFIALGVIIEGETRHAALIGETITRSLQEISLRHRVPVIHEVLLLASEVQAQARCLGDRINRGVEAARVAARMVEVMTELRAPR